MSIINVILVLAADVEFAVAEAHAMVEVVAIRGANPVSPQSFSHLRNLNAMPVFVLQPGSRAAVMAARLDFVFQRVLVELFSSSAVAAAGVGFHAIGAHILRIVSQCFSA